MNLAAQDHKDYQRAQRYVEEGDEHFIPVVEWFQNGKKRNYEDSYPYQHKLAELIKEKYSNYSTNELVEHLGEYYTFWYRLRTKQYNYIPTHRCKILLDQL